MYIYERTLNICVYVSQVCIVSSVQPQIYTEKYILSLVFSYVNVTFKSRQVKISSVQPQIYTENICL